MQKCSICNVFNDDALIVILYWSYTLRNKDYTCNKGKCIIGTTLIIVTKLIQPFQPYSYEHQLNSQEQTYKNILYRMLQ